MTNCERVDYLAHELIDGWLNGEGKAPSFAALFKARRWVRWLPKAGIFPTPEGGILYEYGTKQWCFSIEFEADGLVTMMATQVRLVSTDKSKNPHLPKEYADKFTESGYWP